MTLKTKIIDLMPSKLELAARYYYNKALGRLEPEAAIIEELTRQRRRCLDIGANVGLYTYRFAQLFESVESFEPIPACARIIASSKQSNVRLHNLALSNRQGRADLSIPATGGPEATALASLSNEFPEADLLSVELRTLDSFGFTQVDLIKIDVEGHELEVLEGGVETIRRELPTLLIEIEQRHHASSTIHDIFDFILKLGYIGSFYWNGRMMPLTEFSVPRHQQSIDPRSQDYVNNFIFRPAARL
jgi:FkbM family methyltransferase